MKDTGESSSLRRICGNCREIILSADGTTLSYITGTTVNEDGETEDIMIKCHK